MPYERPTFDGKERHEKLLTDGVSFSRSVALLPPLFFSVLFSSPQFLPPTTKTCCFHRCSSPTSSSSCSRRTATALHQQQPLCSSTSTVYTPQRPTLAPVAALKSYWNYASMRTVDGHQQAREAWGIQGGRRRPQAVHPASGPAQKGP
jgi:hypothetical protein